MPAGSQVELPTWRRLSVRHLWLLAPLVAVLVKSPGPVRDASFLWHVRAGTLQLELGEVLRTDPFSFTFGGRSWRTQSWLVELGYGLLENLTGGIGWVSPMLAVAGSLTLVLVMVAVHLESRHLLTTVVVAVPMAWLGTSYLVPRPVLFGNLFLALLVVVLAGGARTRWTAPFVLWVWAAVHGSFVIGLGLLVLEGLRRAWDRRTWIAVVGCSVLAASATAHGWRVWEIVLGFARSRGALAYIAEWAAPELTEPPYVVYALLIGALFAAAVLGRIHPRDMWVAVPFLLFGLSASRALFPAAIVLAPLAARLRVPGPATFPPASAARATLHWGLVALWLVGAIVVVGRPAGLDEARFPDQVLAQLRPGPTFHDDFLGGYLIYAYWPEVGVFVDDRAELYGEAFFDDFLQTRRGLAWREVFHRYGIVQAVVHRENPLAEVLALAGWEARAEDERFVLFTAP